MRRWDPELEITLVGGGSCKAQATRNHATSRARIPRRGSETPQKKSNYTEIPWPKGTVYHKPVLVAVTSGDARDAGSTPGGRESFPFAAEAAAKTHRTAGHGSSAGAGILWMFIGELRSPDDEASSSRSETKVS